MRAILLMVVVVSAGCGTDSEEPRCAPGESIACVGGGGCAGGQICNEAGTGFGSCDCGSPHVCGDGVTTGAEECDQAIEGNCMTSCGSTGTRSCTACAWDACEPPTEACDDEDDDCDGAIDEGDNACGGGCGLSETLGAPCDGGDGDACDEGVWVCDGLNEMLCSDAPPTAVEACDGDDNDCDGTIDEGDNACGGTCVLTGAPGQGCDGADADQCPDDTATCAGLNALACSTGTDNIELPDGIDQDCDGTIDEGTTIFDDDLDGWTESFGDCDDADADVYPGTVDPVDGVDNNCNGVIDEPETGGPAEHPSLVTNKVAGTDYAYASSFAFPFGDGHHYTEAGGCSNSPQIGDAYRVELDFRGQASDLGYRRHTGEDWNGDCPTSGRGDFGLPVLAIANGVVVYSATSGPGWGHRIIVRHDAPPGSVFHLPDGRTRQVVYSIYAHVTGQQGAGAQHCQCTSAWFAETVPNTTGIAADNATVTKGQRIGSIGSGWNYYSPHLHFELAVDPAYDYIGSNAYYYDPASSVPQDVVGCTNTPSVCRSFTPWTDPSAFIDMNTSVAPAVCTGDADGDGHGTGPACAGPDCNDNEPAAWTGRTEVLGDNIDNQCNGMVDEYVVTNQSTFQTAMAISTGTAPVARRVILQAGTYTLGGDERLGRNVWYEGSGSGSVTVNLQAHCFEVNYPGSSMSGVTLTNGGGCFQHTRGGALGVAGGGALTLTDVTVTNSTTQYGGAIAVDQGGSLTASRLRLTGNSTNPGQGGALFSNGGTVSITGAVIANNTAQGGGGGISIFGNGANTTLRNVVVANNVVPTSNYGGGIFTEGALQLRNVSLIDNVAQLGFGGGFAAWSTAQVTATSLLVYSNSGGNFLVGNSAQLTISYSLVAPSDHWGNLIDAGNNLFDMPPSFVQYSDNSIYDDNFRLSASSPGRNAGSPALGNDVDGSANDMGAYGGPSSGQVP